MSVRVEKKRFLVYLSLTLALVGVNIFAITTNTRDRKVKATPTPVRITYPGPDDTIANSFAYIGGTAGANKKVSLFVDNRWVGNTDANLSGEWSFKWDDATPGTHNLRATVIDGTGYAGSWWGGSPTQTLNLNSGQKEMQSNSGFAGILGMPINTTNNMMFVINGASSNVSVVNTATRSFVKDIELEPGTNQSLIGFSGQSSIDFGMDNQHQKLFIMVQKSGIIYVIDTAAQTLQAKIQITASDAQRLIMSPNQDELFVLSNEKIRRIDTSNNEVTNTWTPGGIGAFTRILYNPSNQSFYYLSPYNLSTVFVFSPINDTSGYILATPNNTLTTLHDIALSQDGTKLSVIYEENTSGYHVATYGTTDNDLLNNSAQIADSSAFLNVYGINDSFYIQSTQTNQQVNLQTLKLTDYSITNAIGLEGRLAVNSFVISEGKRVNVAIDAANSKLYQVTKDTVTQQAILNTVNLTNMESTPTSYDIASSFINAPVIALDSSSDRLFVDSGSMPDAIVPIDLNDNSLDTAITHGTGNALKMQFNESTDEVYTAGISVPTYLLTRQVSVLDGSSGQLKDTIELPSGAYVASITLNQAKTKLYITASLEASGETIIYRVDTLTHSIDKAFASIPNNIPAYTEMRGDNLYVASQSSSSWNLIKLNTETDALSTVGIADKDEDDPISNSSFLPLYGNVFTVSPSGNKAVLQSKMNGYTVIDTVTMTKERTVDMAPDSISVSGGFGFFMGLTFAGGEDHLYVGSLGLFVSGYLKGFTISYVNLVSGAVESSFSATPSLSTPAGQLGFGYIASLALSADGKTLYSRLNYALIGMGQSESSARYKTTQSVTAIDVSSKTAVLKHDMATSQLSSEEATANELSINSFMFGASLSVNDQTQTVEQSIKVGGDGIKITSPNNDEQLTEKSPLISGTSPGESTITVSIDGNVLGTTTATKEGKWSIKATSLSAGKHSIHAEYGRDKNNNLYIGQFGLFGLLLNPLDLTQEPGIIDVFDTEKETFSGKIALPNGGVSYYSRLSNDGKNLLVYGLGNLFEAMMSQQQPSVNLWLVDTKTNKVTKTFQFDTASWQGGVDMGVGYMLSPDSKELIAARTDKIVIYDTEKLFSSGKTSTLLPGAVKREIILPATNDSVFSEALPPNMFSRLVQNGEKLVIPYYHQIATVDLSSGAVVTIGEEASRTARSVYVNDSRNEAYVVTLDTGAQTDANSVIIINTVTGQVKDIVNIPGTDAYIIGALDPTLQSLRLHMSKGESAETNVISLNLSNKSLSTSQNVPVPTYYSDKITELLSYNPSALNNPFITLPLGIGFNANKTKTFTPTILFGLAEGDENSLIASKLFNKGVSYFTIGDEFSGEVPGAKYTDDIGVTLGEATSCTKTNTCPPPPTTCIETNTCPVVAPPSDNPAPTARTALNDIRNKAKPSGLVMQLRRIVAAIRRFTSSLPRTLLEASPFILIILLLAVIASFLYQTSRELKHNRVVNERLAFASLLATEKNNFLQLISHYLRTPLTVLSGGIEMAKADTPPDTHRVLAQSAENLSKTTEALLEKVENEPELKALDTTPVYKVPGKDVLHNKYFAIPAIILAVTLGFFYLFFVVIGGVRTTPVNIATQILGLGLTIQLLYGTVHNNLMIKRENARMVALIGFEKRLDAMRSEFIREAQYSIGFSLQKIQELTTKVPNEQYRNYIMKGVNQYNELLRSFRLVTQLENSKVTGVIKPVHVNNAIGDAVKELVSKIQEKKLNVDIAGLDDNPQIRIEPTLLSLTVKALLSNAIDASAEGSNITIKAHVSRGKVAVSVIDHGVGMSSLQKDALFKPFSRIDDTETFNKEGAGLSLYLSRMILHAFKGDLGIESAVGKGTTASISLPILK